MSTALPDLRAGVWRHYKGHLYQVLGYAHDANATGDHPTIWKTAYRPDGTWNSSVPARDRLVVVYIGLETTAAHKGPRMAVRDVDDFLFAHMHPEFRGTYSSTGTVAPQPEWRECTATCPDRLSHRPRFEYLGPGL